MKIKFFIYMFVLISLIFSATHILGDSNHNILCYSGFTLIIIGSLILGFDYFRNKKKR